MATLYVGGNSQYQTLSAAVNASSAGDTIYVNAGTYTDNWTTIDHDLNIVGLGEVNFTCATRPTNGKGMILINGGDVTFDNLNFSGVYVGDGNGAPIVQNKPGDLTITDCSFSDSQQAVRVGGGIDTHWYGSDVVIDNCDFSNLGSWAGHGMYISSVETLTVKNSEFSDIHTRHAVKSRALNTTIENNHFQDGETGTASYFVDVPQSGNAVITGNTFIKGANASNPNIIAYGGETQFTQYPDSSLTVTNNDFISYETGTNAVRNFSTTVTAQLAGNTYEGVTNHAKGLYEETSVGTPVPTTNTAPDAVNDTATVEAGKSVVVKVLANDTDANGDTLSVSAVGSASKGTVAKNADGTVTYTANATASGSDSFTYTISDGKGGTDTATVSLTLTSAPVGNAVSKSTSYTLKSGETDLVLTGTGNINGTGNAANNKITGNDGNNVLSGAGGHDTLLGGAGHDTINGGVGNDSIDGGTGNDRIYGNAGQDVLTGGSGADTFVYKAASESTLAAPDTITDFTAGSDRIELTVDANSGLSGTQSFGFIGGAAFTGVAGQLNVVAQSGGVLLQGDTNGDKTADFAVLVKGVASLSVSDFTGVTDATATVGQPAPSDAISKSTSYTLADGEENLLLTGTSNINGTGNSLDNTITGNDGNNTLSGQSGDDTLVGAGGSDYLNGGGGNDSLAGGNGDDKLIGNTGADTLSGGAGADSFIYWSTPHGGDRITDFSSAEGDTLDVNSVDANTKVSGNQDFKFVGTTAFSKTAGELRYAASGSDLLVQADTNGDGVADMTLTLAGVTKLAATDFVL